MKNVYFCKKHDTMIFLCHYCNSGSSTNADLLTPLAIFVPAIIAIISWGYNAKKMRELEEFKVRFQERFKVRNEMLKSCLNFWLEFQENKGAWNDELVKKLEIARSNFLLYGNENEQSKMEAFIEFINATKGKPFTNEDKEKFRDLINELLKITKGSIRNELNINS